MKKLEVRKKLLLLYPGDFYSTRKFIDLKPHMVYLYSFLKKYFEVSVIDLDNELPRPETDREIETYKKKALKKIKSKEFEYFAISCWTSCNYLSSKYFAEEIKKTNPKIKIIVGGYHPTFVPQDFTYKGSPFDFIIKGEIDNILEIIDDANKIKKSQKNTIPDLINYPYFNYQKEVGIFLSYGCPFKCSYCMEYRRKWKSEKVEDAIKLISTIEDEISPEQIFICDACFGFSSKWKKKILSELVKRKSKTRFWTETRVDFIDIKDLKLISKLNFKIDFGIDSFSKQMLTIMNKTKDPNKYLNNFIKISKKCSELKIPHDAYLIFDHPGESKSTYKEYDTFFNGKIKRELKSGYLVLRGQTFSFFPGSYVYYHLDHFKKRYGTEILHPEWWKEKMNHSEISKMVVPSFKKKPYFVPWNKIIDELNNFNKNCKEKHIRSAFSVKTN